MVTGGVRLLPLGSLKLVLFCYRAPQVDSAWFRIVFHCQYLFLNQIPLSHAPGPFFVVDD